MHGNDRDCGFTQLLLSVCHANCSAVVLKSKTFPHKRCSVQRHHWSTIKIYINSTTDGLKCTTKTFRDNPSFFKIFG